MEEKYFIERHAEQYFNNVLKNFKIDFNLDATCSTCYLYELYIGSGIARIQVEFSDNKDDDIITYQLWIGSPNQFIYNEHYNENNFENVEVNIEELINATKNYNKAKAKIDSLFDKIRDVLEDYQYNIEFDTTSEDVFGYEQV